MTRREWLLALGGITPAMCVAARALAVQAGTGDDLTTLSIRELGAAYASGRVTPIDVAAAYLSRIDRENPALGAYVTVSRGRAVDDTKRLLRIGATWSSGSLMGVPVAHKDLFATRGIRTTGGSKLHEHWVPDEDAVVVSRVAAAGTILLGKTNSHELGGGVTTINPFTGTTHNPGDVSRIPGGSSGGSAAAVTGRLALVATGSDTGGSVRIPAALCGCVGLKPTFGLASTVGLLGACPTFDHVGVLTRTAEDAALMLPALVDPDAGTAYRVQAFAQAYRAAVERDVRGLRVGLPREYFFDTLEPGVARAVDALVERLRRAGARVHAVTLPASDRLYDAMFAPIAMSEIRATYAREWQTRPDAFSKDFATVFDGPGPTPSAVATAREARDAFQRSVEGVLSDVDLLLTPTVPMVAPRIDGFIDGMRILRNTWAFNAARVPAVSIPCGAGDMGLPVGVQVVGRPRSEAALLGVGTAIEQLIDPTARPPRP